MSRTKQPLALIVITLVALIAGILAGPALAQGDESVNCNGLSDDDCAILQAAHAAMGNYESVAVPVFNLEAHLTADGETLEAQLSGSGAMIQSPAMLELAEAAAPGDENALGPVWNVLSVIDSAMIEAILTESAGYINLETASIVTPEDTMTLNGELVLRDGGLYLHLPSPTGADSWFGDTMDITASDLAELDASLDEMRRNLDTEEFQTQLDDVTSLMDMFSGLGELVDRHTTTTRGDDAELHGQTMVTFTTTFDLAALLADPDLVPALVEVLADPAFEDMEEVGGANEAQVQLFLFGAALVFSDTSFTVEQWVGADDGYFHRAVYDAALPLNLALFGGDTGDADMPTDVDVVLRAEIEMNDFNAVDANTISVPDEYAPLDDVEGFLPGTADMIERTLEPGESFNGALTDGDERDIYAVTLAAGDGLSVELDADGYATLAVYGPDGFLMDRSEPFGAAEIAGEAEVDGLYLIVVEGTSGVDYELTLRVP